MTPTEKGKSPFYPGQPVPVELFAGRRAQIEHIVSRGVGQVSAGKPIAMFIQGEYGIGKSSIAGLSQWHAEREFGLHGIYAPLGAARTLDDLGASVLEATLRSGVFQPTRAERVREWLAKYVGEQALFGLTIRMDALRRDAPDVAKGLLPFLSEARDRLAETGVRGIFLVLDEINGISESAQFAHFVKGVVDGNAMSRQPLPLLLMLCGVEERRRAMIRHYQPVERIFDVVAIERMSPDEMKDFFARAFESVHMRVEPGAMNTMTEYSAGFPKLMHLIGDAAYWLDQDGVVSEDDAIDAVVRAADDVGRRYVEPRIYNALKSRDYQSILRKIAEPGLSMTFQRKEVEARLTADERRKFGNFLTRMKSLNALRAGEGRGEHIFTDRLVRLYLSLSLGKG